MRNTAARAAEVFIDVLGYYPSTAAPGTTPGVGRYASTLLDARTTGYLDTDTDTVRGWADADAASGARTVLLDLGAQTENYPLSGSTRGIALAQNYQYEVPDGSGHLVADPARLSYADLATLVRAYLARFAADAPGRSATVLLAVSNTGDWKGYGAALRGTDFAAMIDSIPVPTGFAVHAAGDFEPGFDDNQGGPISNPLTWKAAYQGSGKRPFVFVGAASGCPTGYGATGACVNAGSAAWSQAQLGALASGTATTALPQIYNADEAVQWADIAAHSSTAITFAGTLSEFGLARFPEFTPAQAHAALYRSLSWARTSPALGPLALDLGA